MRKIVLLCIFAAIAVKVQAQKKYSINPYVFYYDHKEKLKGLDLGSRFEAELVKYSQSADIDSTSFGGHAWASSLPLKDLLYSVRSYYSKGGKPFGIVEGMWAIQRLMDGAYHPTHGSKPTTLGADENFFVFQIHGKLSFVHVWKEGSEWRLAAADDGDEKKLSSTTYAKLQSVTLSHAQFISLN